MANGRSVRMFFYACTLAMFVESVRQAQNIDGTDDDATSASFDAFSRAQIRKFRAQRNVYLTFFALFLVFVIERTCKLIISQSKAERMLEVLQKQAQNNQKEYVRLATEKEGLSKTTKQTKEAVEEATKVKKQAKEQLKQAENQQASFVQLIEELTEVKEANKTLSDDNEKFRTQLKGAKDDKDALQRVVDDYSEKYGDIKKDK